MAWGSRRRRAPGRMPRARTRWPPTQIAAPSRCRNSSVRMEVSLSGHQCRAKRGRSRLIGIKPAAIICALPARGVPMAKAKRMYGCTECGATFPKWAGQCADCGAWNTLVETVVEAAPSGSGRGGWAGQQANLKTLAEVSVEEMPRFTTGSTELDRVLGGG
ncbi:hypothetical protein ALP65_03996, partial [Pseudomonas aeruginosa]